MRVRKSSSGAASGRRAEPKRLLDGEEQILTKAECEAIAQRIFAFARGGGETQVQIGSWTSAELRWARNRVSLASERRDVQIQIQRLVPSLGSGQSATNQLDDESLEAAVRSAERGAASQHAPVRPTRGLPPRPIGTWPKSAIWSDSTFKMSAEARGEIARTIIEPAEAKGYLSAGYIETHAGTTMRVSSERPTGPYAVVDVPYSQWTQAQCSMTVRDQQGSGSGWAGLSSYDWQSIDPGSLGARALQKCEASRNPVVLEPGRYTVILEPQAVAGLMQVVAASMNRIDAESGSGPWALALDDALQIGPQPVWRTKLGLKVIDERITIDHDPFDPRLGILPQLWMEPLTFFDKGVLTNLEYNRDYAITYLGKNAPSRGMWGYRMSGGTTSIDEMIATTQRGLLVTRFSDLRILDGGSLLSTGLTRDGLWLIEHGKISKAVKNLRFTESPLFALNSIEQLGVPVPVFRPVRNPYEQGTPLTPAIVPPLKARDFSFTSTIDAI
jgi:predicted Zn-dependent protease